MAKIVFIFAGTAEDQMSQDSSANDFALAHEDNNAFNNDVIRIYVRGCARDAVGGDVGYVFPDLEIVSDKINKAFSKQNGKTIFNLDVLKAQLQDGVNSGIYAIYPAAAKQNQPSIEIESIGLTGFSRGGVTCYAVAKKLNHLTTPIDIIANQPVPGQNKEYSIWRNLYENYHDLSACHNIRSAVTLIGTCNQQKDWFSKT